MNAHSLTPGSTRALQLAARLARIDDVSPSPTASHLLWALVLLESRASEILSQVQVDVESLKEFYPLELLTPQLIDQLLQSVDENAPEATPASRHLGTELLELTQNAVQYARQYAPDQQAGTESLLYALLNSQHDAAGWLLASGLDPDVLNRQLHPEQEHPETQLEMDFQLSPPEIPVSEQHQLYRILDVNLNRLREGLRVVEDYCRLAIENRLLTDWLKHLRHDLANATKFLPPHLIVARDTAHDLGTSLTTPAEYQRTSPRQIALINAKRVGESLRTLEEYGKAVSTDFARGIEQIRYRFYAIEQRLATVTSISERLLRARLYLLVSENLCPGGYGPVVRNAIAGGVDVIQLREKNIPDRRLLDMAKTIRAWTQDANVLMIVNDRADIAVLAGADGVHLGQEEPPAYEIRKLLGPEKIIGVSTHSLTQAQQAIRDGADYIGVGPVFSTTTKQFSSQELVGLDLLKEVAREIQHPWFAIGGVTPQNINEVISAGASRVAVSSAICAADNVTDVTRAFQHRLSSAAKHNPAETTCTDV